MNTEPKTSREEIMTMLQRSAEIVRLSGIPGDIQFLLGEISMAERLGVIAWDDRRFLERIFGQWREV